MVYLWFVFNFLPFFKVYNISLFIVTVTSCHTPVFVSITVIGWLTYGMCCLCALEIITSPICIWWYMAPVLYVQAVLTLNPLVIRIKYSWRTRSIPWLQMTWLLASPSHQQSWFWLHKIFLSVSSMRNEFNYLSLFSFEKMIWHANMFLSVLKTIQQLKG